MSVKAMISFWPSFQLQRANTPMIVGDLLLEVEVVAVLDAALACLGDGVVGGDAESQLARVTASL